MKKTKLPNKDVIYCIDKMTARDVYQEIYVDNVYLLNNVSLHSGDLVFDIGANIGMFSKYIDEKYSNLKIYAFEPIPQIFSVLKVNLKEHSNIKLYQLGISNKEENTMFNYYPKVSADSTANPFDMEKQIDLFVKAYHKGIAKVLPRLIMRWLVKNILKSLYKPVKVSGYLKTVSQIIEENNITQIDLLKLDAENAERQVLEGIKASDWDKIKQIAMEIHTTSKDGATLVEDICRLLESKGFKFILDKESRFSFIGVHMLYATRSQLSV